MESSNLPIFCEATKASSYEQIYSPTSIKNIELPVGRTYVGPVTAMRSVETQTEDMFGNDALVSVPFSALKKLLLEGLFDKNKSQATPSLIGEVANNPHVSKNQHVESDTETQVVNRHFSRFEKQPGHTSSVKGNGASINDIRSSNKETSKKTHNLSVKVKDVKSHSNTQVMDPNGMCKVCGGGRESKHVHYGGKSCHSCRAFFRRMSKTFAR